ncbi:MULTISPECIES: twin-arginine translocase subunit TatC [unclassified Acidisoma]|uniref:twin-arginine translocase subunit TatC n=1 Tax=unclassified Acidisoma TaxID=2634065 RepID=UPI00131AA7DD|nr:MULTISPECIES: twin-arginine translocase subunit TatC [unclassified Acidisoma]
MPLLEHLAELRTRLLWSAGGFLIAFFVCYHFSFQIYEFIAHPLVQVLKSRGEEPRLIYTALYEAFFTYIKVSVYAAAFISFPIISTQVWLFIAPGLYRSEKRALLPFIAATPILFLGGAALAYYFIFPMAFRFFLSFQTPAHHAAADGMKIELMARVSDYLGLVMKLVFAFGVAFELPVALTLMGKVGIISSKTLKKFRRYAYVGCFVVAAVLTPPDVLTQTSLAVPLILLYEISIIAVRLVEPKPLEDD